MCASSFFPATHTQSSLKCFIQAQSACKLFWSSASATDNGCVCVCFPQVCLSCGGYEKTNKPYFICLLCHFILTHSTRMPLSLMFISESYQTTAWHDSCRHAVPAQPAIPHGFLTKPYLSLMSSNYFLFTHLLRESHWCGTWTKQGTRIAKRSMYLVILFCTTVITYTE